MGVWVIVWVWTAVSVDDAIDLVGGGRGQRSDKYVFSEFESLILEATADPASCERRLFRNDQGTEERHCHRPVTGNMSYSVRMGAICDDVGEIKANKNNNTNYTAASTVGFVPHGHTMGTR